MVIAAPRSVSPVAAFRPAATIPPIVAMIPPAVGDTELAITSLSSGTTCGSAADSEARKNRFTPSTSRYETYSGSPWLLDAISAAVRTTKPERSSADRTRICRRDQRSMNTPANGPISEYGRYKTVSAEAAAVGLVNVVALKNTYVPMAAVTIPSPVCDISRVQNSRLKFCSASTVRRSETNADRVIQPITSSSLGHQLIQRRGFSPARTQPAAVNGRKRHSHSLRRGFLPGEGPPSCPAGDPPRRTGHPGRFR